MCDPVEIFLCKSQAVLDLIKSDPNVGAEETEPQLLEVLTHLKDYPDYRAKFVEKFIEMLHGKFPSAYEVIEFCMRELQWPEILDEINRLLPAQSDPRNTAVLEEIARVYEKEWRDWEFYEYYRNKEGPPQG